MLKCAIPFPDGKFLMSSPWYVTLCYLIKYILLPYTLLYLLFFPDFYIIVSILCNVYCTDRFNGKCYFTYIGCVDNNNDGNDD